LQTVAALGLPPGALRERLKVDKSSQGVLLPGQSARIVAEDGSDAARGDIGELWLMGENIAMGYLDDADATSKAFVTTKEGRWLRTGDRFRVDENGSFLCALDFLDSLAVRLTFSLASRTAQRTR
jgi:acyl-CoA synthetase (AMP-forming)/AMP-acid ligase II